MGFPDATARPYAAARAWVLAEPARRAPRSTGAANDARAIASLPPSWGERLDALGATYRHLRWLAGAAGAAHVVERCARYEALVWLLSTCKRELRFRAFRALCAEFPRVGRQAKRVATERRRVDELDAPGRPGTSCT